MPTTLTTNLRMIRISVLPAYVDQILIGLAHSGISVWVESEPGCGESMTKIMFEVDEEEIY